MIAISKIIGTIANFVIVNKTIKLATEKNLSATPS